MNLNEMIMKRFYIFFFLLIVSCALSAQDTAQNYIRTRRMLTSSGSSYLDGISYHDGLGRPFQQVEKAVKDGSRTGSILASLQEYDAAGRESGVWLPVTISGDYLSPASLKSSAPVSTAMTAVPIALRFTKPLRCTACCSSTDREPPGTVPRVR